METPVPSLGSFESKVCHPGDVDSQFHVVISKVNNMRLAHDSEVGWDRQNVGVSSQKYFRDKVNHLLMFEF